MSSCWGNGQSHCGKDARVNHKEMHRFAQRTYGGRFAAPSLRCRVSVLCDDSLLIHAVPPLLVLWELAKYAGKIFPETWNTFLFRRFWGEGVILSTEAYFVMDSYEDVRAFREARLRRAGEHSAGEQPKIFADSEMIHGTFSPQAAAMLTALFLRHTGKVLRIATDTEVGHKKDAALIFVTALPTRTSPKHLISRPLREATCANFHLMEADSVRFD